MSTHVLNGVASAQTQGVFPSRIRVHRRGEGEREEWKGRARRDRPMSFHFERLFFFEVYDWKIEKCENLFFQISRTVTVLSSSTNKRI